MGETAGAQRKADNGRGGREGGLGAAPLPRASGSRAEKAPGSPTAPEGPGGSWSLLS